MKKIPQGRIRFATIDARRGKFKTYKELIEELNRQTDGNFDSDCAEPGSPNWALMVIGARCRYCYGKATPLAIVADANCNTHGNAWNHYWAACGDHVDRLAKMEPAL